MVKYLVLRGGIGDTPTNTRMIVMKGLETNPSAGAAAAGDGGADLRRKASLVVLRVAGVKTHL